MTQMPRKSTQGNGTPGMPMTLVEAAEHIQRFEQDSLRLRIAALERDFTVRMGWRVQPFLPLPALAPSYGPRPST